MFLPSMEFFFQEEENKDDQSVSLENEWAFFFKKIFFEDFIHECEIYLYH